MDEERSLISGRAGGVSKVGWIINLSILLFAFLAFIFAALAYSSDKTILHNTTNNNYNGGQGLLVQQKYKVGKTHRVEAGHVVSFCEGTNEVCSGLGPVWTTAPFAAPTTFTPAVHASLEQVGPSHAVYAWVSQSNLTALRILIVQTESGYQAKDVSVENQIGNITHVYVKSFNSSVFAILFTAANEVFLQIGIIGSTYNFEKLGDPLVLFPNDGNEALNLAIVGHWVMITYSPGGSANYLLYTIDGSSSHLVSKVEPTKLLALQVINSVDTAFLGTDKSGVSYVIQASGNKALIGTVDFDTKAMSNLQTIDLPAYYQTITVTPLYNNWVSIVGVQVEGSQVPITLSLILEWNTTGKPYLKTYAPNNLLETQYHFPMFERLSVCYNPVQSDRNPNGELFFSYVDSASRVAHVMRGRVATLHGQVQVIGSHGLPISVLPYGQFGSYVHPLVSCPTSYGHTLMVYQYFASTISAFEWAGGYRYAGIAAGHASEGEEVLVVREGVSYNHYGLQPGYSYFADNRGFLLPYTSIEEIFTYNSFSGRVGVAISDTELLLESNVFGMI